MGREKEEREERERERGGEKGREGGEKEKEKEREKEEEDEFSGMVERALEILFSGFDIKDDLCVFVYLTAKSVLKQRGEKRKSEEWKRVEIVRAGVGGTEVNVYFFY